MINILKELSNTELEKLIEQIKSSNDIENTMILLQMIEINLEEKLLEDEKEIKKTKEEKIKKELENIKTNKKELKEKINNILDDFINRPSDFFNLEDPIDKHINKKLNFELIPSDKKERTFKADSILKTIAQKKINKINPKFKAIDTKELSKNKLVSILEKINALNKNLEIQKD